MKKLKATKKKTPRQKLIKENDKLFSLAVRSKGYCERCNKTENLQCAHIVGRGSLGLRWKYDNALCLCYACHIHWAHKEPIAFAKFVCEKKGQEIYAMLRDFKPEPMKLDRIKLINIFLKSLDIK